MKFVTRQTSNYVQGTSIFSRAMFNGNGLSYRMWIFLKIEESVPAREYSHQGKPQHGSERLLQPAKSAGFAMTREGLRKPYYRVGVKE
jgi:hypothetical protein